MATYRSPLPDQVVMVEVAVHDPVERLTEGVQQLAR